MTARHHSKADVAPLQPSGAEAVHLTQDINDDDGPALQPWNPINPYSERPTTAASAREVAADSGYRYLLHNCCKRCRKPPSGCAHCAAGFSRPPAEDTTIDQCRLAQVPGTKLQDRPLVIEEAIQEPPSLIPLDGQPTSAFDERVLCLRLKRTCKQDLFTSETNAILQGCASTMNTNVAIIMGGQEAKNRSFYMSKYMNKLPTEITEFSPLIMKKRKEGIAKFTPAMLELVQNAAAFPSRAPNHAETKRISQYFLNKTLNKCSGLQEFSSHQHAALLLGMNSYYTSETFLSTSISEVSRAFRKLISRGSSRRGAFGPNGGIGIDMELEHGGSDIAGASIEQESHSQSWEFGEEYIISFQHDAYIYRPLELYILNYDEFSGTMQLSIKQEYKLGNGSVMYCI